VFASRCAAASDIYAYALIIVETCNRWRAGADLRLAD
jgi:hypothetical protein